MNYSQKDRNEYEHPGTKYQPAIENVVVTCYWPVFIFFSHILKF